MADVKRVARSVADGVVYIVHQPRDTVNDVVGCARTTASGPHSA